MLYTSDVPFGSLEATVTSTLGAFVSLQVRIVTRLRLAAMRSPRTRRLTWSSGAFFVLHGPGIRLLRRPPGPGPRRRIGVVGVNHIRFICLRRSGFRQRDRTR